MKTARPSRNHCCRTVLSILCFLYSSVFLIPSACAASFAGGTGEPNDPYQIATVEDLVSINSDPNLVSRSFVLVEDIDLDPNLPGGMVFSQAVICPDYRQSFTGYLDGQGHVIRNLVIQGQGSIGLIRSIGKGGVVQDLYLDNIRITGSWSVGGLAGMNDGNITSCSSTGSVTGQGIMIGGLVGENQGTIRESDTAGDVQGEWFVGGLVGWNRTGGILSSCHSTGDVTGNSDVGGLVGRGDGSLSVCYATGHVTGQYSVGGLVGSLMGNYTLTFCYSTGNVTGDDHVGGLVGGNYSGNILFSFSSGNVIGSNWDVGGLVGHHGGGTISSCYSTGSVSGSSSTQHIGGLAGSSSATVSYCYSIGPVTGGNGVGGLLGMNIGRLSFSYARGCVTGQGEDVGGLVGMQFGSALAKIESCYFLVQADGGGPDNRHGTDLTRDQMKQKDSFVGWDFWGTRQDGLRDEWFMPKESYPVLSWQTDQSGLQAIPDLNGLTLEEAGRVLEAAGLVLATEVQQTDFDRAVPQGHILRTYYPRAYALPGGEVEVVVSLGPYDWTVNPGDGTQAMPYEIWTVSQLDSLMDHPELWDRHFLQATDIDLAGKIYSTALIAPDVNAADGFQGTAFTGHFDGQGFRILNLAITTETNDYLGLFGFIGQGATVKRVSLVNVRIDGGEGSFYVGTLAGYSAGIVTDCSAATGWVSGRCDYVHWLIGVEFSVTTNESPTNSSSNEAVRMCGFSRSEM